MKPALAAVATLIAIYSYIPYFRDIFRHRTKPHAFSWFIWFTLTAIGFAAQLSDNGGPGAWVTGFTALVSFFIFLAAVWWGERDITLSDWICLAGALLAIGFWAVTETPLLSVVLITVIDAIGFIPTFRKSYHKPHEETMQTFALSAVKHVLAIMALNNYSIVTILYPASLVIMNGLFVSMLIKRRKIKNGPVDVIPV